VFCNDKILVATDDMLFFTQVKKHLQAEGFDILRRNTKAAALGEICESSPALVMLEKELPGVDGFLACQQVRRKYDGPIIMLTDEPDDFDELRAFQMGADDYICKSVHLCLLAARIKAVIKRTLPRKPPENLPIKVRRLLINPAKRDAYIDDRPLNLTTIQFDVLWYLVNHPGQVVSRDDLNQLLYNAPYNGIDRSIDVYVSRIRHKIEKNPVHPVYLKTVRGVGYIFTGD
jgi:DNA-binding response OmpR family regulator